jgi:hypothetical protein
MCGWSARTLSLKPWGSLGVMGIWKTLLRGMTKQRANVPGSISRCRMRKVPTGSWLSSRTVSWNDMYPWNHLPHAHNNAQQQQQQQQRG